MKRRDGEAGSALVPAVIAIAIFALIALEILDASRGTIVVLRAETDRARLAAAADGGLAMAIFQVGLKDRTQGLPVDGLPRVSYFEGVALTITVQDANGQIAINKVGPDVERRLFSAAGVTGERLDVLVDSLEDWKDHDADPRRNGAEFEYYSRFGIRTRDTDIHTIDELAQLRGMDPALLARIEPALTVFSDSWSTFDASLANPLALAAMEDAGANPFDTQKRLDDLAGKRPVLEIGDDVPLAGRVLTITVEARLPEGGTFVREAVVQFTGSGTQPYWIRYVR
ncbi:MAG: hypothetical protein WDN03_16420 [Rhizomicrobium sp.]